MMPYQTVWKKVFNDILKMQRFLDISRFLYFGGWQVCGMRTPDHKDKKHSYHYATLAPLQQNNTSRLKPYVSIRNIELC